MLVGDIAMDRLRRRLATQGLGVRIGPFDIRIVARTGGIVPALAELYRDYPVVEPPHVYSCHVEVRDVLHLRPFPRRMVRFSVDGRSPHADMPRQQALCVLEWGINLVVALRFHSLLMLHAAVLERNGGALMLPAEPGAGKTTLCAALAHRGWRLFSDEFGLVRPETAALLPLPRPLALKNESIDVIRHFAPEAWLGPRIEGTRKGTIAHMRPPAGAVAAAEQTATVRWLVFPQWRAGSALVLQPMPPAEAFAALATNAFNYEMVHEAGFAAVNSIVAGASCHRLVYSDLDEAVAALTALSERDAP